MFIRRKLLETTALIGRHHKNELKYITTTANGDNDKPYPLDGIRVLDLTRIGKLFEIHN